MRAEGVPPRIVPRVAGTGVALPGEPVDNAALASRLGVRAEWIEDATGTVSRHFSVDLATGRPRWSLADLCEEAARAALADAGVGPAEIGFVVLSTATPDQLMPATVNLVADRLGISHVPTYQIQSGCAGAIQGIDTACRILRDDSEEDAGEARGIGLVIGGDVCAKHMDLNRDFSAVAPGELVNYLLFADGAGAAVVSRLPLRRDIAVRRVLNRFVGLGQAPGQTIAWYGSAGRDSGEPAAREDYGAIKENVPRLAEEIVYELADSLDWDVDSLDFLLPPQLSGRMTRLIAERIGGGAKEISCVTETGNNGNALPFLQLHQLTRVMGAGDRALCAAVESSKWIKGGLALEMPEP